MMQVTLDNLEAIQKFVKKRWPDRRVCSQENPNARHENRYIMISTLVNEQIAHYEYTNGFLEFHLESEYNSNDFNYLFYRYLRLNIYTGTGDYKWHKWFGMKQGRVRYEYYIEDQLDLADALSQMIPYIDSIVSDY